MTQEKLEEARKLYQTANSDQKYVLESLFTELKELEDERIRKALIEFVHDTTGDELWVDYDIHKEDAIAWLEKQGEQKPNPVLDIEIPFGAKDSELQEATYHIPKGFHAEIDDDKVVIKQGEQKPIWSEDDGNRINRLIAYFEDKESFTAEDDVVYANWLKSLKERCTWKPSDEQMEALKGVQEGVFRLGILESLYQDLKKLKDE